VKNRESNTDPTRSTARRALQHAAIVIHAIMMMMMMIAWITMAGVCQVVSDHLTWIRVK